jgi:tetratricopeptide (TPR) repeat protein
MRLLTGLLLMGCVAGAQMGASPPGTRVLTDGADFARLRLELRRDPDNVVGWLLLAQAYLDEGYPQEARDAFVEATLLNYRSPEAHFGLGLAEYTLGDYEAALFAFDELVRLHPERFDGHFNRAVTLAGLRRTDEAAVAFREATLQAEPEATPEDLLGAYLGLAGQLVLAGDFEGAAEAYEGALELAPSPALAFLRAEVLVRAGRGLEVLPDLSELEASLSDYRVSALIAEVYQEAGRGDYAVRALERAFSRAAGAGDVSAMAETQFRLGLLYRDLARPGDAVRAFQGSLLAEPGSWQAHYNLGLSYLDVGQLHNALTSFDGALALSRDSGEVFLARAGALDGLGRGSEALGSARQALERLSDPELRAEAGFIEARALYSAGELEAASFALEPVLAVRANNAPVHLWAGLIYYALGNYPLAAQFYERAVQLDPASSAARVNLGAAYLSSGRFEDAEIVYALLIEEDADNAEAYYNLGWALLSQGRQDEARAAWQRAEALGYGRAGVDLRQYF